MEGERRGRGGGGGGHSVWSGESKLRSKLHGG